MGGADSQGGEGQSLGTKDTLSIGPVHTHWSHVLINPVSDIYKLFFFSERRAYCIFFLSTFAGSNQRYHVLMNFTEKTKDKNRTFLVSMNVTRLFTSILQNEGIEKVCRAYENFYKATHLFKHITCEKCLHLSSKKIIFQFNGKLHLQTHGTAMSTKTAVFLCQHFHGIYWNTKSKQNHL